MSRRAYAFTLIELLTVIAILGLLIAIIFPSLRRAREDAKTLTCLTRLKQLGAGWQIYTDENDGTMVPGRMYKKDGGVNNPANWYDVGNGLKYRPRWAATIGAHVGVYAFNRPSTFNDRQRYDNEGYACPKEPEWVDERNYGFGYNYQFLGNARRLNDRFYNFPVKRSRIRAPGGTVVVADSLGTAAGVGRTQRQPYGAVDGDAPSMTALGNHGWSLDPPRLLTDSDHGTGDSDSLRTAVDPRHSGKANVVFADGHGEAMTYLDLGYRQHEDGRYVDLDDYVDTVNGPPHNRLFSGTGRDDDPPPRPQG